MCGEVETLYIMAITDGQVCWGWLDEAGEDACAWGGELVEAVSSNPWEPLKRGSGRGGNRKLLRR